MCKTAFSWYWIRVSFIFHGCVNSYKWKFDKPGKRDEVDPSPLRFVTFRIPAGIVGLLTSLYSATEYAVRCLEEGGTAFVL